MRRVSASEHDLLTVMRALFDRPALSGSPAAHGMRHLGVVTSLLRQGRVMPRVLSRAALDGARDIMAKGLVLALVRRGGFRRGATVVGEEVVRGRLWERHEPPPLHVSPFALELCMWLVREPLRGGEVAPLDAMPETVADEVILYLAMDLAHAARGGDAVAAQRAARGSALCWLGFADVLARRVPSPELLPADISVYGFAPWCTGAGAMVIEALGLDLARRWVDMERDKRRLGRAADLVLVGRIQEAVLEAYLAAVSSAGRRDLAAFVIEAAAALLVERPGVAAWVPALEPSSPLHARESARRAAVVLLRELAVVERWAERARAVRFFDDGYDVAQLFLRLWEPMAGLQRRAGAVVADMESIDSLVA